MLRQLRVRISRASPALKLQGLRVVYSKNFLRATFFVLWGSHLVDRFSSYLPMKRILLEKTQRAPEKALRTYFHLGLFISECY